MVELERYIIKIKVNGREAEISLKRILSPISIERIYRNLPMRGLAIRSDSAVYISVDVEGVLESSAKILNEGEVGLDVGNSMLVIALRKITISGGRVTKLGEILSGLESVKSITTGMKVSIDKM